MGQSRRDKEWPRPSTTRHCWIKSADNLSAPTQGFVLLWTRHSYRWSALVVYVVDGRIVQEWMPKERLAPVRPRPTDLPRDSY